MATILYRVLPYHVPYQIGRIEADVNECEKATAVRKAYEIATTQDIGEHQQTEAFECTAVSVSANVPFQVIVIKQENGERLLPCRLPCQCLRCCYMIWRLGWRAEGLPIASPY